MKRRAWRLRFEYPRVLRQTVGETHPLADHAAPSSPNREDGHRLEGAVVEFDDGNGLWITFGETPSDQD